MIEDSVSPELFALLTRLMNTKGLESFALGGGTSLALRFGHRCSVDIDLFSASLQDFSSFRDILRGTKLPSSLLQVTQGSLCLVINETKVDLLRHHYDLLNPVEKNNGIRMFSLSDIAAMKVNAAVNRGSKKDFVDLLALSEHGISLANAIDFFCTVYGESSRFMALRSLVWFEDADKEPDPIFLNRWNWGFVKNEIQRKI